MKKFFALMMLSITTSLWAGGAGNGGCETCQESYKLGLELAVEIVKFGNEKVTSLVPLIKDVQDVYKTAKKRKIIPESKRKFDGRTAISDAGNQITMLNLKKYKKLADYQKRKIEIHELFVLMNIEEDGVYEWTEQIMELFPNYYRLEMHSDGYTCNEGVCVVRHPKAYPSKDYGFAKYTFSEDSSLDGICKYFGLKKGVNYGYKNAQPYDGSSYYFATVVDENGNLETSNYYKYISGSNEYKVYEWIRCTK